MTEKGGPTFIMIGLNTDVLSMSPLQIDQADEYQARLQADCSIGFPFNTNNL